MAIQIINLGTPPSGADGDTARGAFTKINANFSTSAHAASRLVGSAAGNVQEIVSGLTQGVSDFNNLPLVSIQFMGASLLNAPLGSSGWFLIDQKIHNGDWITQIAYGMAGLDGRIFFRQRSAQIWGGWVEIYHQRSVLGTVSMTNGLPSGALIEHGSNANGTYVRFADGTQMAFGALTTGAVNAVAEPNGMYGSNAIEWTMPVGGWVTGSLRVFGAALRPDGDATVLTALHGPWSIVNGTGGKWRAMVLSNQSFTAIIRLMAVGQWY
ncbi:pyocin knob domain-containing protein [Azorhizophilus paspali]|uniref:Pyocin knob domain-containing protein n=1 Tax=Azorhizophilus paspali TaxID=69963 RepID=A0ABV6SMF8_AZOPA